MENSVKIVFKSALDSVSINNFKNLVKNEPVSFEIHLNKFSELYSNKKEILEMGNIETVHAPIGGFGFHNLSSLLHDISDELSNWSMFLREVSTLNDNKGSSIVIHNDMTELEVRQHQGVAELRRVLAKIGNVSLKLENSSVVADMNKGNYDMVQYHIPSVCQYLNDGMDRDYIIPLLDTCHMMIDIQTGLSLPGVTWEDYFNIFSSDKFTLHLAYAIGSGEPVIGSNANRHGVNFNSNEQLLGVMLDKIKLYSKMSEITLVLEIYELNYVDKPIETEAMLKMLVRGLKKRKMNYVFA